MFKGEKAQCEARVFPVQSAEEAKVVLWQAADKTSRQMQGTAFGLPAVRAFVIDGRDVAESEFWVQSGTSHLEGRIRLLRASPQSWALAWGLATPEAAPAARDAAIDFASTLVPSEPAFFEPPVGEGDPEEELVPAPGEPALTRRHLRAVLALVEAGARVRFSRAGRLGLLDALAMEARQEGPKHREALRTAAEANAESLGLGAESRAAAREQLGKRILELAQVRSDAGKPPAQLLLGHDRAGSPARRGHRGGRAHPARGRDVAGRVRAARLAGRGRGGPGDARAARDGARGSCRRLEPVHSRPSARR